MNKAIHILLRLNSEGLRLDGCLALESPPASFLDVHAQCLPNQLTLGSVLFLGDTLGLFD
jgi:hypothetical protein